MRPQVAGAVGSVALGGSILSTMPCFLPRPARLDLQVAYIPYSKLTINLTQLDILFWAPSPPVRIAVSKWGCESGVETLC